MLKIVNDSNCFIFVYHDNMFKLPKKFFTDKLEKTYRIVPSTLPSVTVFVRRNEPFFIARYEGPFDEDIINNVKEKFTPIMSYFESQVGKTAKDMIYPDIEDLQIPMLDLKNILSISYQIPKVRITKSSTVYSKGKQLFYKLDSLILTNELRPIHFIIINNKLTKKCFKPLLVSSISFDNDIKIKSKNSIKVHCDFNENGRRLLLLEHTGILNVIQNSIKNEIECDGIFIASFWPKKNEVIEEI